MLHDQKKVTLAKGHLPRKLQFNRGLFSIMIVGMTTDDPLLQMSYAIHMNKIRPLDAMGTTATYKITTSDEMML